tara:strand:+ start:72 stop:932 length:861 start_codon:yes stop_codon:yes gene_type:complete
MSKRRGFDYEVNAYRALKEYDISFGASPAGAASDRPDLEIRKDKKNMKTTGVELKLSPTAAGSLVLKYYSGKWSFDDPGDDPEKLLMIGMAKEVRLFNGFLNSRSSAWGRKTPLLQNDPANPRTKLVNGNKFSSYSVAEKGKFYDIDISNYGGASEVIINVPASKICDYYKAKKCSYMQVASHGFYILNGRDDFGLSKILQSQGLPKIPDFKNSVKARIRCRCQIKSVSKKDYQFVMTLDFQSAVKSPYNLAPIMSARNVKIKKSTNDDGLLTENNMALLSAINGD